MPPTKKLSRDEVVAAARRLLVDVGPEGLNARDLGRQLGVSARPLYSHFPSMEALRNAVADAMAQDYAKALVVTGPTEDRFLNVGLAEIRFARDFPREYRLIHDAATAEDWDRWKAQDVILDHLESGDRYGGFSRAAMADLLVKMSLFTQGLAQAALNRELDTSDAEILRLLQETGSALIAWAQRQTKE